jgi:hypothetical protein
MPANSEKIRTTLWIERDLYYGMHRLTAPRDEDHAAFIRRAIETQIAIETQKLALVRITAQCAAAGQPAQTVKLVVEKI